jgi:DNA-binding beta-propeller fold protein YncE
MCSFFAWLAPRIGGYGFPNIDRNSYVRVLSAGLARYRLAMRSIRVLLLLLAAAGAVALTAGCGGSSSKKSHATRPGCSSAVSPARALSTRTGFLRLGGSPFGIATTADGRWAFVDEVGGHVVAHGDGAGGQVAVLADDGFTPRVVRTIGVRGDAVGNSLTRDGRYLLVADGSNGATVVSVHRAETGARDAVLGTLSRHRAQAGGGGAIEVASSPDGHYAFVSIEYGGGIAVYDLRAALADDFHKSTYLGTVRLGLAVVGMAVSPDGRRLYATSELAVGTSALGARPRSQFHGSLSVISISQAARDPQQAVLAAVPAGCSPVRVAVSSDGSTVWVTARESNRLLAFSAGKLLSDPKHARLAAVHVGEAPVGLALVSGGRDVIVADSNRFGVPGARAELTVVSTAAALAHRPAVVGTIPAGSFPREMAVEPDGQTLLVSNFGSDELEAVDVGALP